MMNYLAEIKAFYDLLEINSLPAPCISLWQALMSIANKTGWQQEFTAAVSVLMLKSGLNAQAVNRARNRLAQDGYITWRSRRGNQAAVYHMNSLVIQNTVKNVSQYELQSVSQSEPQYEPQSVSQSEPINKHKLNETYKTPIPPLERFEFFRTCYPLEKNRAATEKAYADVILDGVYGEDELVEAAKNYAEYCRVLEVQKKYVKTPARWLSEAAFEDYLPGRYKKPEAKQGKTAGFEQRSYDFDALERALVGGMRT